MVNKCFWILEQISYANNKKKLIGKAKSRRGV
jgi:hypothetical protein